MFLTRNWHGRFVSDARKINGEPVILAGSTSDRTGLTKGGPDLLIFRVPLIPIYFFPRRIAGYLTSDSCSFIKRDKEMEFIKKIDAPYPLSTHRA